MGEAMGWDGMESLAVGRKLPSENSRDTIEPAWNRGRRRARVQGVDEDEDREAQLRAGNSPFASGPGWSWREQTLDSILGHLGMDASGLVESSGQGGTFFDVQQGRLGRRGDTM